MFSCRELAVALALTCVGAAQAQTPPKAPYPEIGRAATPLEIAAWDIDVRPDFKGLPKGSGSVAKGMEVWEGKCASCHGIFGESNEVFSPIVGGTTKDDIKTGRAARLNDGAFPGRTTLMKVSTVSTLWDYIRRAMPWTAPKSLSTEEIYAVTAYILNMGSVLPDNFTLSDKNIAEVQKLLPNRNGTTVEHGLWPGTGFGHRKPDVQAVACMKDCSGEPMLASFLPEFARNAHGNLAEQNRAVGAQHGADTDRPASAAPPSGGRGVAAPAAVPTPPKPTANPTPAGALALAQKYSCTACHGVDNKIVGPGFRDIAKKHAGRDDVTAYLAGKIRAGGTGVWGAIPMPAQTLPDADSNAIAKWIAAGAPK
jgi:S-disulfanyl-L-cysteine oxidoreductase SoxD